MLKVCSLDFLYKKFFDTDIMAANGRVLCHAGEAVTPELLLKLYFKEIYIEEPVQEKEYKEEIPSISSEEELYEGKMSFVTKTKSSSVASGPVATSEVVVSLDTKTQPNEVIEETIVSAVSEEIEAKEQVNIESSIEKEKAAAKPQTEEKELTGKIKGKGKENEKEVEAVEEKAPNPEDEPLIFDEEQAKRVVEYSKRTAKLLKLSPSDIKDLEQAAYYCNYGATKFKKSDMAHRNFSKMRAYAGYELLTKGGLVPESIAEIVKISANNYVSESFSLNSPIPLPHIIAIANYYDEHLTQSQSKQATLLKMLQLGGNHFNIFILHKFIHMMRSEND